MTAQEAYNKVIFAKTKKAEDDLTLIKAEIAKAVENNQLKTGFPGIIDQNVKNKLELEGFKIETFFWKNERNRKYYFLGLNS